MDLLGTLLSVLQRLRLLPRTPLITAFNYIVGQSGEPNKLTASFAGKQYFSEGRYIVRVMYANTIGSCNMTLDGLTALQNIADALLEFGVFSPVNPAPSGYCRVYNLQIYDTLNATVIQNVRVVQSSL